jgi:hypothetical protein
MADFGEALAINAQDAEAFNSRGTIHTALGQYDRDPPSSRGQLPISLGRLCLGRSTPDFHLNCGAAATGGQWAPFWW